MMKKEIVLCFCIFSVCCSFAQKDRYRFAASYFGLATEISPQSNGFKYLNDVGVLEESKLPTQLTPKILIGGTHFWNRADFYISFSMGNIRLNGSKQATISNSVMTGFRLIPFELKQNKIRPFIGTGFHSKTYRQKGENGQSALYSNWQWYYEAGLVYAKGSRNLLGLEMHYSPKSSFNVFQSRTESETVSSSPYSFSLSYKRLLDFSASYSSQESVDFFETMEHELVQKHNNLNAYSIGVGLSAFIPLEHSEHASRLPFFNDEIEGGVFPELGIAFFLDRINTSARLSYRPIYQRETAYNYGYSLTNHSVALEAFKFLGNYHGFVPFVGPYLSRDHYRIRESDNGTTVTNVNENTFGYGLVFGWDIRFTEVDHFILRTNLRYTPNLGHRINDLSYTARSLEFNFIQLVYYPQRHRVYKQLNQK